MWGQIELPQNGKVKNISIENFSLYFGVQEIEDQIELSVASGFSSPNSIVKVKSKKQKIELSIPEGSWQRCYINKSDNINITPSYPDKAMFVELNNSFNLLADSEISGWISTNCEVSVNINKNELMQFSIQKPFRTLFGSSDNGTICRYYKSDFTTSKLDKNNFTEFSIVHPITIRNQTGHILNVSELCIYGDELSIIQDTYLYSETIVFTINNQGTKMNINGDCGIDGCNQKKGTLLVKSKISPEERFINKSFELFKTITKF